MISHLSSILTRSSVRQSGLWWSYRLTLFARLMTFFLNSIHFLLWIVVKIFEIRWGLNCRVLFGLSLIRFARCHHQVYDWQWARPLNSFGSQIISRQFVVFGFWDRLLHFKVWPSDISIKEKLLLGMILYLLFPEARFLRTSSILLLYTFFPANYGSLLLLAYRFTIGDLLLLMIANKLYMPSGWGGFATSAKGCWPGLSNGRLCHTT